MYEVRLLIVANSAAMESKCSVANFGRRNARNADVNGLGFHMLAMQRHAVSMFSEVVIAPRSAIAADNVDRAVWMAEAGHQIVQQIELFHIVIFDIPGAVIAQEMIELRHRIRQVAIANAVHNIDVLPCMKMDKPKPILFGRCGCISTGRSQRTREKGSKNGYSG